MINYGAPSADAEDLIRCAARELAIGMELVGTQQASINSVLVVEGGADIVNDVLITVDDGTGNIVSSNWNSLSEETRQKIIGGTTLFSVFIPAGAVGKVVSSVPGVRADQAVSNALDAVDGDASEYLNDVLDRTAPNTGGRLPLDSGNYTPDHLPGFRFSD